MCKVLRFLVLPGLFLLSAHIAICQEFPALHYTFEDGLPSNTIYQIYKDSKGFLWIATDKGVARYNGIKFEVFTVYNGLPDNEIYLFKEDYEGRLWIGAANGKLCFYKNDTFHTEDNTPFLKMKFKTPHVSDINLEFDSSITINFFENMVMVNIYKDSASQYDLKKIVDDNLISIQYKRKIAPGRYKLFGRKANAILSVVDKKYSMEPIPYINYDTYIRISVSQNAEYIFNDRSVYSMDTKELYQFKDDFYLKNHINTIYNDGDNFFFATKSGLFLTDSLCILKNDISAITQDNTGNYWVGTLTDGIFCIRKDFLKTRLFRNMYTGKILYTKAQNNNLFYITPDNNLYNLNNGKPTCLFDYKNFKEKTPGIPNEPAYLIDSNNNYYGFYGRDNITIDNILSKTAKAKKYNNPFFPGHGIKTIITDGANVFVRLRHAVIAADYDKRKSFFGYKYLVDSSSTERTYYIAKDADNALWYSTIRNMYKIQNGQSKIQTQLKGIALKSFDFLGDNMVGTTFENKLLLISNLKGDINVDSITSGQCVWDRLYKLNDSMMLISTNNQDRLLKIHPRNAANRYSLSVIEDPFVPINIQAFCSDGSNCYFFKNGSVTVINIKNLFEKSHPPEIFFSHVKTTTHAYYESDELEIPYNESRNIAISFVAHSFSGKDVSFQYSVSKNGEDLWRPVKGQEINLVNSGYGDYLVKIKAKTISSDESQPLEFTLHIPKPYWATWWFITLCTISVAGLIGAIVSYRIRYALKRKEAKHESEVKFLKLEYKALNAMMNPHFIFNALNSMQALINKNEKLAANKYLSIFSTLVRQNMHNISLELISLDKELEMVDNYLKLEKLRFKDHLNYSIIVDEKVDTSEVMVAPLLVQPLVENAIKHGLFPRKSTDSIVNLDIYEQNNCLVIAVKDNGIGMEAAKKRTGKTHQSYGLENIRKRIAQLAVIQNKQISLHISEVKNEAGKLQWTIVSISISR